MQYNSIIDAAAGARGHAYAPYSQFKVGAALLTKSGKIFVGCNVENISFGLTICAERAALANAISHGGGDFEAIAIVTDSEKPAMPCGACRQVLAEFNPNMIIIVSTVAGGAQQYQLSELLPRPTRGILEGG
jgi:cytidine deaminase